MRFAPYLSEISFAFSKAPTPFTEMALNWSNDGLKILAPSHVEYTSPKSGAILPLFFENTNPTLGLANLPEGRALKGALKVAFSDGDVLDNLFIDYLFVAFLTRLAFKYIPHETDTSEKLHFSAKISWQIDPLLINRVDYYTIKSAKIIENKILKIRSETEIVIHSMEPGDTIPITLAAIGFDGLTLGSVSLTLYVPLLKIIPTRTHIDGVGYGKQIDPSGIQETYQVNHNKTIAQMTLPTQQHTAETKSLGKPLSLLNPASVKSSDAKEYVNAFDPNEHNTPFDYSAAKDAGANIAPQATASFNENRLGNYTLNHQGTLNKTTTVDTYTEFVEAPQINNEIDTYQGNFSGNTYSKTVNNYYEQAENETLNINEHALEAPTYTENIDQLDEVVNNFNVNSQTIFLQGGSFSHNGTMFLNGDFEFCSGSGTSPQAFVQPTKTPNQLPDPIYQGFVATVYSEAMSGRVLLSAPNVRYASGALLYYWYVSGQKSYEEIVSITQSYIKQMNHTPGIHSTFDTGYYNNTDFPNRSPQDDAFAKMAIASVIINRANGDYSKNYHAAIKNGDPNADVKAAYGGTYGNGRYSEFNGYGDKNYFHAISSMQSMKNSDDTNRITDSEVKNLYNMLWNIFYKRQVTTDANLYFSPIAQIETVGNFPSWVLTINDFKHISSFIENKQQLEKLQASWRNIWCGKNIEMISDDFAFFSIPENPLLNKK